MAVTGDGLRSDAYIRQFSGSYCTRPKAARYVQALAASHDLVVVADGAHSVLREAVTRQPRRRWSWTVWQASLSSDIPLPADACVNLVRPGFFSGIFRLPAGRTTWFAEQPGRARGTGDEFLAELAADDDPVLRAVARATAPGQWTEWSAADMWPPAILHRGNIVLTGGPVLRRVARPDAALAGQVSRLSADASGTAR
jgi:2-polyprenyl-6-methoxyphenol hydroxylase-like FAD-dependent oxidoreductase